jgi:hypothetical protein
MKKILTIILAFLLNCSCVCVPILAEQSYNEITNHETIREEKVFISICLSISVG